MTKKKHSHAIDQPSDQQELLNLWLEEIKNNPRFKDESLPQKGNLKPYSKQFLSTLFNNSF